MKKGAVVLLENPQSKGSFLFLKQKRDDYQTEVHYAPPAGTFEDEKDDDLYDTAVRELEEEAGITIKRSDLDFLFDTDASYGVDKLTWYHVGYEINDSEISLNQESSGYRFMTAEQALEENLLKDTRNALERLIE